MSLKLHKVLLQSELCEPKPHAQLIPIQNPYWSEMSGCHGGLFTNFFEMMKAF